MAESNLGVKVPWVFNTDSQGQIAEVKFEKVYKNYDGALYVISTYLFN